MCPPFCKETLGTVSSGGIKLKSNIIKVALLGAAMGFAVPSGALDVASTNSANHINQMITGGTIPTTSTTFTTMVTQVASGNLLAAAQTAATSEYFCNYLARRL